MSTEDPPPSLNRSYDVSSAGRRTRSARSSGKRSRIRQASSTSSVPATTTAAADDGDQRLAAQDGRGSNVGDTSGLLIMSLDSYATVHRIKTFNTCYKFIVELVDNRISLSVHGPAICAICHLLCRTSDLIFLKLWCVTKFFTFTLHYVTTTYH